MNEALMRREGRAALGPLLLVAALPLILLALNDTWIWDNPYYHDTSVYVGYFRHYLEFKMPYIENYKSSRLPFLLPGVLLYRLLPPAAAHHLLFLLFLTCETALLFVLARRRFGQHAAFAAAGAAAVLTFSHTPTSYHNQAASAYFMASLALLEMPERFPRRARAALAGGAFAFAVTTDMIAAGLFPVFALHALAVLTPRGIGRAAGDALAALAGAVLSLAALGALNVALGGPFLFLLDQINISIHIAKVKNHTTLPLASLAGHLKDLPWLTLPLLTGAASSVFLVARLARRRLDWAAFQALCFLVSLGAALLMQHRGLGTLEYAHFFHPWFAPMFLALAGLVRAAPNGGPRYLRRSAEPAFLFTVAALLLAPLAVVGAPISRLMLHVGQAWPFAARGLPFAILLASIALAVRCLWKRPAPVSVVAAAACFGLMNAVVTEEAQEAHVYQIGSPCPFRREAREALLAADEALSEFDPRNEARWIHSKVSQKHAQFDGVGWCRKVPVDMVGVGLLLPHYFFTSSQFIHGAAPRPGSRPTKLVLTGRSAAQLDAMLRSFRVRQPPGTRLTLKLERRFTASTFSVLMHGYDVASPR